MREWKMQYVDIGVLLELYDIRVCNYLIISNKSLQSKQRYICITEEKYIRAKWIHVRHTARKFTIAENTFYVIELN